MMTCDLDGGVNGRAVHENHFVNPWGYSAQYVRETFLLIARRYHNAYRMGWRDPFWKPVRGDVRGDVFGQAARSRPRYNRRPSAARSSSDDIIVVGQSIRSAIVLHWSSLIPAVQEASSFSLWAHKGKYCAGDYSVVGYEGPTQLTKS